MRQLNAQLSGVSLRNATVTAVTSDVVGALADLQFDDTSDIVQAVRCLDAYVPYVNDVVRVLMMNGGGPLVIGTVQRRAGYVNKQNMWIDRSTQIDFTSTSWVSYSGLLISSFTKYSDHTDLEVSITGTGYIVTTSSIFTHLGALISGTDYEIAQLFYNSTGQHQTYSGFRQLLGIPAGTYSVQGRVKLETAGTFRHDTSDYITMSVMEIGG
jgi:hypothetical protein